MTLHVRVEALSASFTFGHFNLSMLDTLNMRLSHVEPPLSDFEDIGHELASSAFEADLVFSVSAINMPQKVKGMLTYFRKVRKSDSTS